MGDVFFMCGEVRATLAKLPPGSVQAVVTSPPYFGLRSYGLEPSVWGGDPVLSCPHEWTAFEALRRGQGGEREYGSHDGAVGRGPAPVLPLHSTCVQCGAWRGCLGLEPTVQQYVANLVEVLRGVWRVLRDDGLVFLNLGDSYGRDAKKGQHRPGDSGKQGYVYDRGNGRVSSNTVRPKSLCLIPQRVAIALAEDGWVVRNYLIWRKPNKLPESVKDRFTVDFEPILMLAKTERYYFDMEPIREPAGPGGAKGSRFNTGKTGQHQLGRSSDKERSECPATRQPRTVWDIPCQPLPDDHFAAFPEALVERALLCGTAAYGACGACGTPFRRVVEKGAPLAAHQRACGADANGGYAGVAQKEYAPAGAQDPSATKARILAGMRERRTVDWVPGCRCDHQRMYPARPCLVLDPFSGSGTVGRVAKRLGRRAILIDQSPEYVQMARRRVESA